MDFFNHPTLLVVTFILIGFSELGSSQGFDCASQIRSVEQRCREEAFGWINYAGIGKQCCRNMFLDRCMKQRVSRECQSLTVNWLSPELRNWITATCTEYSERRCEDLLVFCNHQRDERIDECTRLGKEEWSGNEMKDKCCLSHSIQKCLENKNLQECFDDKYSLATYLAEGRDYRLRQECYEFPDISACEDNTLATILLGILVVILVIVLIALCICLVLYCIRKQRTK